MLATAEKTTNADQSAHMQGDPTAADKARAALVSASRAAPAPEAWDEAHARYKVALAARDAIPMLDESRGDDWDDADTILMEALEALLITRAPDAAAMAEKGRVIIEQYCGAESLYEEGASADSPAYLSHYMSKDRLNFGVASLFQDAAGLCGAPSDLCAAEPSDFDPAAWLLSTTTNTHARYRWLEGAGTQPDRFIFEGPGQSDAEAAFAALHSWEQDAVRRHLFMRMDHLRGGREMRQPTWTKPVGTVHLLRFFAGAAANEATKDDLEQRAVIGQRLRDSMRRDVGLPVGLPDFEPRQFIADAYALGMRFDLSRTWVGPEIMHRSDDARAETAALAEQFCQVDSEQLAALTAVLLEQQAWAQAWVAEMEGATGCVASYDPSGIAFGIGPEKTGALEAACTAYHALSPDERAMVQAYAQSKAAS